MALRLQIPLVTVLLIGTGQHVPITKIEVAPPEHGIAHKMFRKKHLSVAQVNTIPTDQPAEGIVACCNHWCHDGLDGFVIEDQQRR